MPISATRAAGSILRRPAFRGTGTIVSASSARRFHVAGLDTFETRFFSRGLFTFTSGASSGLKIEVKSHAKLAAAVEIELWADAEGPPAIGDAFIVTAGCDKRFETCKARFANTINFRGFPSIPGNEFLTQIGRAQLKMQRCDCRERTLSRLARGWIGTPYHHQASLRRIGTDCLGLVRGVWRELYGDDAETPPAYSRDWAEASGDEAMLEAARAISYQSRSRRSNAGDVIIFRLRAGFVAKHAAILTGTVDDGACDGRRARRRGRADELVAAPHRRRISISRHIGRFLNMATLALAAAGAAVGASAMPAGVGLLGVTLSGATIGSQIGALAGAYVDNALFAPSGQTRAVDGPRLSDLHITSSTEGAPLPKIYGACARRRPDHLGNAISKKRSSPTTRGVRQRQRRLGGANRASRNTATTPISRSRLPKAS